MKYGECKPTVEVLFVVLEGEGSVVLPEADDGRDVLGVLVGEALHQHVLVGPPRADLQPLQVEQLLEDAPLDLVPGDWMALMICRARPFNLGCCFLPP